MNEETKVIEEEINIIKNDEDKPKTGFAGLLESLQREDGYISLVRVMAAFSFVAYFALYIFAFFTGKQLPYFDTLSTFVGTVIFATLGSKYLDFRQQINLGRR